MISFITSVTSPPKAMNATSIPCPRLISRAPLAFPQAFIQTLKANFTEREMVILATTAAQVNYWARLIQALGVPPVGYTDQCPLPA